MSARCQLCTGNDEDAVIEHVAAYMWESRVERVEDRTPWADAVRHGRPLSVRWQLPLGKQ
jgi:hypothetical protein